MSIRKDHTSPHREYRTAATPKNPARRSPASRFCRTTIGLSLCALLLVTAVATAAEYRLNSASMEQYNTGISYTGTDTLIITVEDDVTIRGSSNAGIESKAPVIIRSPAGKTLTVLVNNNSAQLYGIKAPSVSVESGHIDITVNSGDTGNKGGAFGICAESENVTISGGSVITSVETARHKNKGIYASGYVIITGGSVSTAQHGGSNTFGLDGGDTGTGNTDGGVIITGGYVEVNSTGASERNIGIDSKFGKVRVSGDPVIFISGDKTGGSQNYVYNSTITTISGKNAVIFTSEGGNYVLRENADLAQNATLIAGRTFEIPAGLTLGISKEKSLTRPADTKLLFGDSYGTFRYDKSTPGTAGAVIYEGKVPVLQSPFPGAGLLAGFGAALLLRRKGYI